MGWLNVFQKANRSMDRAKEIAQCADRSTAMIEFELDGTIIWANDHFLQAIGYTLDEIVGRHHRMFVDDQQAASQAYQQFWHLLGSGQSHSGRYRRIRKDGAEIWIQASYNSIFDSRGRPLKVIKSGRSAPDAVVGKAQRAQRGGAVLVAPVKNDWLIHQLEHGIEIRMAKLLPLSD